MDGMQLKVVESTPEDCEIKFAFRLPLVEGLSPDDRAPFWSRAGRNAHWVFKDTIEGWTKKLEKLQGRSSLATIFSTGHVILLCQQD